MEEQDYYEKLHFVHQNLLQKFYNEINRSKFRNRATTGSNQSFENKPNASAELNEQE